MIELIQSALQMSRVEAAAMTTAQFAPSDRISPDAMQQAQLRELLAITRRIQSAIYATHQMRHESIRKPYLPGPFSVIEPD